MNIFKELDKKQTLLQQAREELHKLSIRHMPTRKKFMKRLHKINSKYNLFENDELQRYTDWLFTLKYERNMETLFPLLKDYSRKEMEYLCTPERIAFLDKVKVVKRLERK